VIEVGTMQKIRKSSLELPLSSLNTSFDNVKRFPLPLGERDRVRGKLLVDL